MEPTFSTIYQLLPIITVNTKQELFYSLLTEPLQMNLPANTGNLKGAPNHYKNSWHVSFE
jgi:hypothetical protein